MDGQAWLGLGWRERGGGRVGSLTNYRGVDPLTFIVVFVMVCIAIQTGIGLDKVTLDMLGQAQKAVLRQDAATILLTGKHKVRLVFVLSCLVGLID